MANEGQPTVGLGTSGEPVRRLQRALRRVPRADVVVDGRFGPGTQAAVRAVQEDAGLAPDGIAGPATWAALPDGTAMPRLQTGASGTDVTDLQRVLTDEAPERWEVTPQGVDGRFGPRTRASVEAFQTWGRVNADGIVADRTWTVALADGRDLELHVGLRPGD
jgi:peptidoglycan hydrolase-like protein with peptidoglycan-binding domain